MCPILIVSELEHFLLEDLGYKSQHRGLIDNSINKALDGMCAAAVTRDKEEFVLKPLLACLLSLLLFCDVNL